MSRDGWRGHVGGTRDDIIPRYVPPDERVHAVGGGGTDTGPWGEYTRDERIRLRTDRDTDMEQSDTL